MKKLINKIYNTIIPILIFLIITILMLYINITPLITLLTSTSLAAITLLLNASIHNNQYSNKNIKNISGTIKDTKTYTYPVNKIIRSKDKVKKRIRKK